MTYEDDWALLQRSALFILTALYTLQVKTLTQCRAAGSRAAGVAAGGGIAEGGEWEGEPAYRSRTASCSSQVTLPMMGINTSTSSLSLSMSMNNNSRWDAGASGVMLGGSTRNSSAPMSPTQPPDGQRRRGSKPETGAAASFAFTSSSSSRGVPVGIDMEVELLLQQQEQKDKADYLRRVQEEADEEQENLKALLSAAVAKLSLVLASEWGKLTSPLGGFGNSSAMLGIGMGLGSGASMASGVGLGLGMNMSKSPFTAS